MPELLIVRDVVCHSAAISALEKAQMWQLALQVFASADKPDAWQILGVPPMLNDQKDEPFWMIVNYKKLIDENDHVVSG